MAHVTFSNDWLELLADPYAVLGITLTADEKTITKHYRRLAMQLHPDRYAQADPKQQEFAGNLVARLINPAYGKLKQERERAELLAVLRLQVKQLQKSGPFMPTSESARMLMQQPAQSVALFYEQEIAQLSEQQYESFTQFGNITHQLHELNLAFLQRQQGTVSTPQSQVQSSVASAAVAPATPATTSVNTPTPSVATAPSTAAAPAENTDTTEDDRALQESYALRHYERAQQYIEKGAYDGAVQEMKDALRMVSDRSEYHALLSYAYLLQDLPGMSKVYCRQALKIDPEDKMAKKLAKKLKLELKSKSGNSKKKNGDKKRSLLGGLFSR